MPSYTRDRCASQLHCARTVQRVPSRAIHHKHKGKVDWPATVRHQANALAGHGCDGGVLRCGRTGVISPAGLVAATAKGGVGLLEEACTVTFKDGTTSHWPDQHRAVCETLAECRRLKLSVATGAGARGACDDAAGACAGPVPPSGHAYTLSDVMGLTVDRTHRTDTEQKVIPGGGSIPRLIKQLAKRLKTVECTGDRLNMTLPQFAANMRQLAGPGDVNELFVAAAHNPGADKQPGWQALNRRCYNSLVYTLRQANLLEPRLAALLVGMVPGRTGDGAVADEATLLEKMPYPPESTYDV